tara:strand:+ start:68 stop:1636 length:1569 start_codon:yes stop_codon:yes gene_type:complete
MKIDPHITNSRTINKFKLLKEEFYKTHKDFYDYSKVVYKSSRDKVIIICPVHREFQQTPDQHKRGGRCPKCSISNRIKKDLKIRTDSFLEQSNKIHKNKYDYSKVVYQNVDTKVTIICPIHGKFQQTPSSHINTTGCTKCGIELNSRSRTKSIGDFISESKNIHKEKYDYSKVDYKNNRSKVIIICSKHGEFKQSPKNHLKGQGCKVCYSDKDDKLGFKETFIKRSNKVHNNKYDYSKVYYKDVHKKVTIICPIHGEFQQSPNSHQRGHECMNCTGKVKITLDKFLERSKEHHGDKYDYSKVKINKNVNHQSKLTIICPIHGEFKQMMMNHVSGRGCEKCSFKLISDKQSFSREDFIEKSQKVHGDKYNYDKVNYKTMVIDVIIVCKEHGDFLQQPFIHSVGSGCPKCSNYGFNTEKKSIFYIRKISLNGKVGLKYGITNQLDGNRENQQKRGIKEFDSFETIYKSPVFETGENVLEVENIIKDKFGKKGYFTFKEMRDGFTETIPFNKMNLDYLKSLLEEM